MAEIITMPKLGFDMAEGTLVRWVVPPGDQVSKGDIVAEIETDKATVEVESPFSGVLLRQLVKEGEIVPVNTPIAIIAQPGEEVDVASLIGAPPTALPTEAAAVDVSQETPAQTPQALQIEAQLPGGVRASPLARRMAREMHISLTQVKGSGPGGRVTKKDVQDYLQAAVEAQTGAPQPVAPTPFPAPTAGPAITAMETKRIPINRLRLIIGKRMQTAKQTLPHFYVTYAYEVSKLLALRRQVNAVLPEAEKISLNDFIVKAVALSLRLYPNLNASIEGETMIHHGEINIGVAVAIEGGLLTVVCRQADVKPLRQIASEIRLMVDRARQGKVKPEDIEGSTFSVSNLGMFDVEAFTAIINPPEAAILAVGAAKQVPVVQDEQIRPAWQMKATLSVDHRLSDGAEAARFLQHLAEYLEQPMRLLL